MTRWPTQVARWVIARSVDAPWRETTLGDLDEECAERHAANGPVAAQLWYAGQAVMLALQAVGRGLSRLVAASKAVLPGGSRPMGTVPQEIRTTVRALRRQPGLALVVAITLALGVGVNAATLSMLDALVLRPLSLADADRLTMVAEATDGNDDRQESVAPANYYDWRREATSFDRLAAYAWWWVNLAGGSEPEHVLGFQVTGDFFEAVGARPALGRLIAPSDEVWGHDHVVVLSDQLWRRRFGARPDVIGQTIRVDGAPYTVIGVTLPTFDFPMRADLWGPLGASPERVADRTGQSVTVIGRLGPGKTLAGAQSEMTVLGDRSRLSHPVENRGRTVRVYTLAYGLMDIGLPSILGLVQAGALLVLLIAGLNVSNLLLARSADRRREFSVRLALGASRARLVRQLVIESAVMGLAAVPAALACAWVATRLLRNAMPPRIERYVSGWHNLGVDGRLVLATTVLAVLASCLVSLIPAIRASGLDPNTALKEGGRSATAGRARQRLQSALVVGQMALVLPLLVASTLATIGAERFGHGPQGYDPTGVLTLQTALPESTYADDATQRAFTERLLDRVAAVPGAASVGMINFLPASGSDRSAPIEIDGVPRVGPPNAKVSQRIISGRYFDTLRIPLLEGRAFTAADQASTQPVAIVSQAMARRSWPTGPAMGRRFRVVDDVTHPGPWLTVVGIVGDIVDDWYSRRNAPMFYQPFEQSVTTHPALAVRAAAGGDPTALAPAVLRALHDVDPDEPASDVMSMDQLLHDRTTGIVVVGGMMGVLGGLALALAVVGLYSLLAYFVARRQYEIGIRMALGAGRTRVLWLTLRQAWSLSAVGIAIGLGLAFLLAQAMESALFGTVALEPAMVAAVVGIVLGTTLVASLVPARRATRTDPVTALREA
jgi:putative ABC transport system permease protein